jgi:hypothetical protein
MSGDLPKAVRGHRLLHALVTQLERIADALETLIAKLAEKVLRR